MERFRLMFSALPDPRAYNARHDLVEVLFIALAAILCGAEGCADMAQFGLAKEGLLRTILRLDHGIPSHDTFSRVFRMLDPRAFEIVFANFARAMGAGLSGVVAIDGKAVRGAFEQGRSSSPLHLFNVWGCEARLTLAQCTAPGRNEVAGALLALKLLSLKDCTVTADALHCRKDIAAAILERRGQYCLALKANHPKLLATVRGMFERPGIEDVSRIDPPAHDRIETRSAAVVVLDRTLAAGLNFPGLAAVGRIEAWRKAAGKAATSHVRHFLLSTPMSPDRLLDVARRHWGIENRLHWVLDVVFKEDAARNRAGHRPENISIVRKIALNAIQACPAAISMRMRVKRAGWDDAFLLSLFSHMR